MNTTPKNYKTSNSFTNYEQREVDEDYLKKLESLELANAAEIIRERLVI